MKYLRYEISRLAQCEIKLILHTPQAYIFPEGDILCEAYIIRSETVRISLQKALASQVLFAGGDGGTWQASFARVAGATIICPPRSACGEPLRALSKLACEFGE